MSDASSVSEIVADLVQVLPLRAAGFIVTLYGDAVVPRGGAVWIGTIIETCAAVGISETLVRTAVSRLVASGQLEGWRRGRRSFYRLSDGAQAEVEAAGRLIYGPPEPWRWRFVHPGFRWRRVTLPEAPDANVIMLRVGAGQKVPQHTHTGTEYTQVLTGAFSDSFGRYRAGDCVEADEDVDHQPVVDPDGECICLAAVDGRLRLDSWIGRMLQPLIGI